MKPRSLTTRVLSVSGLVLTLFGAATLGLMYRTQRQLSLRAMDSLLTDDAFSLSLLVNSIPNHQFDFELTPLGLSNYQSSQTGEFFRFFDMSSGRLLRESLAAPSAACELKALGSKISNLKIADHMYRVKTVAFQPEIDEAFKHLPPVPKGRVCLIVGVDQATYFGFAHQTLLSAVPLLFILVVLFMGVLFVVVRILMQDLTKLNDTLQSADFGVTHAFPQLPAARTKEVKAVAEQLQKLHDQAAQAYQEIWLFLGRAAHQLKTPVAGIQATIEVTLRKERTEAELLETLKDLGTAANFLTGITHKLVSSARISYESIPRPEPVDLGEFFVTQMKQFQTRAEQRGIELRIKSSPDLKVLATRALLDEIFGNLIENAVLYSKLNGCISLAWSRQGTHATISVQDNGPGFPKNVKSSLFKPFIRGDERQVAGSGLGLSIAFKAAQLLNGFIALEESRPTGSLIRVTLPLASE